MKSTETAGKKKFRLELVCGVIAWTLICVLLLWSFVDDKDYAKIEERTYEAQQEARSLQRKHEDGQDLKIRSHEERLKVLETAVVDLLTAKPKQSDSQVVQPAVLPYEPAEAVSDEDFRAMVLKNAKHKERIAIVKHFKQEDEFKKSLSRTEKKKFDNEVKKAYENLLAECGIDQGSLGKWPDNAFRQSVETAVILEWRMDDYSNRQVAVNPVSAEEREEKLEKLHHLEDQLAELAGETEVEDE